MARRRQTEEVVTVAAPTQRVVEHRLAALEEGLEKTVR